jgi:hypothetical protein
VKPNAIAIATTIMALIVFFASLKSSADDDQRWAGNLEMNSYRLGDYKNFAQDWKLVTVRYRMDSGEFRFVYANPIAWKALSEGKKNYPLGAVFAKTAYLLSHDTTFAASLVPDDVNRYQLMIRDDKKHADTGGWGYAVFDKTGRTMPGNPKQVAQACNACHQIVQDLGGVFSKPIATEIAFTESAQSGALKRADGRIQLPGFETVAVSELPQALVSRLPEGTKTVRSLKGDLRKLLFQGTLDEVRPFLSQESISAKMPAVLLSEDKTRYSAVFRDPSAKNDCGTTGSQKGVSMIYVMTTQKIDPRTSIRVYSPQSSSDSEVLVQMVCAPLN